jgi:hypothetical protein
VLDIDEISIFLKKITSLKITVFERLDWVNDKVLHFACGNNMIHSSAQVRKKDAVPAHFCDSYMMHEESRKRQDIE